MPPQEEKDKHSSIHLKVDLSSVDAMFATLITKQDLYHAEYKRRFDEQDNVLAALKKEQASTVEGFEIRLRKVENYVVITKVRVAGFVAGVTAVASVGTYLINLFFEHFWSKT